jgi:lipopolysaccharide transport system ATP-binding protein
MKPIIHIEGLSKRYVLGERARYLTLRESLANAASAPFRFLGSRARQGAGGGDSAARVSGGQVWALRDISFDVAPGEIMGVIGRNGAGKSTLLKILSRVTEPTTGRIDLYGRLGSLLEVGTGFHPELTGRENIFLSGTILGMRRAEIARKFDEIVAFSEIEDFVDTPVKRYSSGMYVRLAFAVAAHLETEILLVDEVLAVGDLAFQDRCLGKMGDVARQGRTILFVSHNMASIEALCGSCILLADGKLVTRGEPAAVIGEYVAKQLNDLSGTCSLVDHSGRARGVEPAMRSVTIFSDSKMPTGYVRMGAAMSVHVEFSALKQPVSPVIGVAIRSSHGAPILGVNNRFIAGYQFPDAVSNGTIICEFDSLPLVPGRYSIDLYFGHHHGDTDEVHDAIAFEVLPADVFGSGQLPPTSSGPIFWPAKFSLEGEPTRRQSKKTA